jgi:hypothetical protein
MDFGSQLDQMTGWLDANCDPGFWAMAAAGTGGIVNDAPVVYFLNSELARGFVKSLVHRICNRVKTPIPAGSRR